MTRGIVITGTDTGVGKSVVAAGIARALGAAYWKPVQAGLDDETDSALAARLGARALPEAYRLITPCSPHQAAAIDGLVIDPVRLALPACDVPLVVEGAGGVLVPLVAGAAPLLYADMFARWALPAVLVARTSLGTINHSLLSAEALRARGVAIAGVAFVGEGNDESERTICQIGGLRRLGRLPWLDPLGPDTLSAAIAAHFDLGWLL